MLLFFFLLMKCWCYKWIWAVCVCVLEGGGGGYTNSLKENRACRTKLLHGPPHTCTSDLSRAIAASFRQRHFVFNFCKKFCPISPWNRPLCTAWCSEIGIHVWSQWMHLNRPIVLLGSGLETGHPDQGPGLFIHFAMLKTVKPAHLLSTSPDEFSCRMFLQESFSWRLTVLGFFDWPMAVIFCSFFFSKESCATGG